MKQKNTTQICKITACPFLMALSNRHLVTQLDFDIHLNNAIRESLMPDLLQACNRKKRIVRYTLQINIVSHLALICIISKRRYMI